MTWTGCARCSTSIRVRPAFSARRGVAVITITDLVTRKWICEIVSGEETSTQIQAAFCDALELEGLHELVAERQDSPADPLSMMPFAGRSSWPSATTGRR